MKNFLRLIILAGCLVSCFNLNAQTALELISRDARLACGNMYPYQPMDTLVSDAPEGFKVFYISHFGRHGSRFDTDSTSRYAVMKTLKKYHDQGLFTELGEQFYQDVLTIRKAIDGNYGVLTSLGAKEQRAIADRMFRHYPELFFSEGKVDTYTTMVPRVIQSRDNFLASLKEHEPSLQFSLNYSRDGEWSLREVAGRNMTKDEMALLNNDKSVAAARERLWQKMDSGVFAAKIFKDPSKAGNVAMFMYQVFGAVKTAYCIEGMPDICSYFTPEELYYMWARSNAVWFSRHGITEDNQGIRSDIKGRLICEAIIEDAQAVIKGRSKAVATLRFGHDGDLNPLMCFLDIEGSNCSDLDQLSEQARDFEVVRTAANLQLVFYRNAKGLVLVKAMRNEKECSIGSLKPYKGCFYKWDDVRKFWTRRQF